MEFKNRLSLKQYTSINPKKRGFEDWPTRKDTFWHYDINQKKTLNYPWISKLLWQKRLL